jgi:hypothetical protein
MTYRLDDGDAFAAAVLAAGNEAFGALVRAGCWCAAPSNLTDGFIPAQVARQIAPGRVWTRLRAVGLTEAPSEGWAGEQIRGYLTHNPSAEKVRQERAAWAARQARARDNRRESPPESRESHAVTPPVTHGPVTASSSISGSGSISIPEDLSLAGEREEQATTPEPAPSAPTLAALAETPGRADGGLLGTLARQADAGHPWCVTTAPRVLARGGRLTDLERARLREIGAEEAAPKARASPSPSSSRPSISLQPPAKPGEHTWKAGEEHTF